MSEIVKEKDKNTKKKRTDNLILILFAYYIASLPIALVIAGLLYPYLENLAYVIFAILAVVFIFLTFNLQRMNNQARIILSIITFLLLLGSIIFPFLIPIQNNVILSHINLDYHSMALPDYIFYLFGVDGTFLIFGLFMLYVLNYDKRTVKLFKN